MGALLYGMSAARIEIDDRALRHLELVIGARLRRNESFFFTFGTGIGPTESSIWIGASIPLSFRFTSGAPIPINIAWIEELTRSSFSSFDLRLTVEPMDATPS
jgi:hypothetical protein